MSKKKPSPKPEGYDELLADIVGLIRQSQAKTSAKARLAKPANTKAVAPKPPRKKPGGRP